MARLPILGWSASLVLFASCAAGAPQSVQVGDSEPALSPAAISDPTLVETSVGPSESTIPSTTVADTTPVVSSTTVRGPVEAGPERLVLDPNDVRLSLADADPRHSYTGPLSHDVEFPSENTSDCDAWPRDTEIRSLPQIWSLIDGATGVSFTQIVAVVEYDEDPVDRIHAMAELPALCPTIRPRFLDRPDDPSQSLRQVPTDLSDVVVLEIRGDDDVQLTAYGGRMNILWVVSTSFEVPAGRPVEDQPEWDAFEDHIAQTHDQTSRAEPQPTTALRNADLFVPQPLEERAADSFKLSFVSDLLADDQTDVGGWQQAFIHPYSLGTGMEFICLGDPQPPDRDWTGYTMVYLHEDDKELAADSASDNSAGQTVGVGPVDGQVARHIALLSEAEECATMPDEYTVVSFGPVSDISGTDLSGAYMEYRGEAGAPGVYVALDLGHGMFTQIYRPLRAGETSSVADEWVRAVDERTSTAYRSWEQCDLANRNWSTNPSDLLDLPPLDECSGIGTYPYPLDR